MKLKMLVYITLLLVLSAGVVQAEEITPLCPEGTLYQIGKHRVYSTYLGYPEDLWKMMRQSEKTWGDIEDELGRAKCPGTSSKTCSELINPIKAFFHQDSQAFEQSLETYNFKDTYYTKDSVIFRWMMFRPNGDADRKIKIAENIKWGGAKDLAAYQFDIKHKDVNGKEITYTFAVPKGCGNLALVKVTEYPECPDCPVCPDNCSDCSPRCIENPEGKGCQTQCRQCKDQNCFAECQSEQCPKNCTEKCLNNPEGNDCKKCNELECFSKCPEDCPQECAANPDSEKCITCTKLNCIPDQPPIPCPDDCRTLSCESCSAACIKNPGGVDDNGIPCPSQCAKCKAEQCVRVIDKCENCGQCKNETDCLIYGKNCSPKCEKCKTDECVTGVLKPCNDCSTLKCNQCSDECVRNPYRKGCPTEKCLECKQRDCIRIVAVEIEKPCPDSCRQKCATNYYGEDCQKCRRLNCIEPCPTEKCPDECLKKCKEEPNGTECQKCNKLNCIQPVPSPFHFIADLGYFRQSDPADYLFGRVGIEYNPSGSVRWPEGVSLLTMIGVAPKVGGSDGDSAFLLDVIAQYNWLQSSLRGFTGLGLGGWFTSGDTEDDSGDSDLDIIANIGVRVLDNPNMSIFLEMRNAVDELDSISEYGRFGAGVRFQF